MPGLRPRSGRAHPLAMVINFEYRELPPNDGMSKGSFWSKLPGGNWPGLIDQRQADRRS